MLGDGQDRCKEWSLLAQSALDAEPLMSSDDPIQQLRAIDDLLDQALALADSADELLVAALISSARDAVERRYRQRGDR
jgi:hypothetical protein